MVKAAGAFLVVSVWFHMCATLIVVFYLVHGEEPYLCVERSRSIQRSIIDADPTAEVETLDVERNTPEAIAASLTALSLFSPHRIVTLRGPTPSPWRRSRVVIEDADDKDDDEQPEEPSSGKQSHGGTPLNRALQRTLPSVADTTDVIFLETRPLPETSGLVKLLSEEERRRPGSTLTVKVLRPRHEQLASMLREQARSDGIEIDADAAAVLADNHSRDVGGAIQEVRKLRAYVGQGGRVTAAVVLLHASDPTLSIFQISDAAVQQNLGMATVAFHSILEQGEEPLRVFALIVRQYRILLYLSVPGSAQPTRQEVLAKAGLPLRGGLFPAAEQQARRLGVGRVRRSYRLLLEADHAIKTGQADAKAAIERVLVELCAADGPVIPSTWPQPTA